MPIWNVAAVDDHPSATLIDWQVFELPDKTRHLVGYEVHRREGRVSSQIVQADFARMRFVTASGRTYELRGSSGCHLDAEYVWSQWRSVNDVDVHRDVSQEVWSAHVLSQAVDGTRDEA